MRKRRYIRAYTGMLLTAGLLSFTWTDGFTVTHESVVLIDPKSLFFVLLFSIIYSFMVDQDRSIDAHSIGLGALYGGMLAFLIGALLTLKLPVKEQMIAWNYALLPLCYGILGKVFADAFAKAREPEKQMKLF
jgi:predicted acyltransferase